MQVTKLGHSCVLVDVDGWVGLFDPGVWSDAFDIDTIESVDRILITHNHPDHCDPEKLRALLKKFPQAHIISNQAVKDTLQKAGVEAVYREGSQCSVPFEAPHEKLPVPGAPTPQSNGFHFKDLVTSPGDSHSFMQTKKVLAMPFIAPWGKTGDAIDKVLELKPEYVLPIHDWHYTPEARVWLDDLITKVLEGTGIRLLSSEPGITHEIDE